MTTSEEFLEGLRSDTLYQHALSSSKSAEERKQIIDATESFILQMFEAMQPLFNLSDNKTLQTELHEVIESK